MQVHQVINWPIRRSHLQRSRCLIYRFHVSRFLVGCGLSTSYLLIGEYGCHRNTDSDRHGLFTAYWRHLAISWKMATGLTHLVKVSHFLWMTWRHTPSVHFSYTVNDGWFKRMGFQPHMSANLQWPEEEWGEVRDRQTVFFPTKLSTSLPVGYGQPYLYFLEASVQALQRNRIRRNILQTLFIFTQLGLKGPFRVFISKDLINKTTLNVFVCALHEPTDSLYLSKASFLAASAETCFSAPSVSSADTSVTLKNQSFIVDECRRSLLWKLKPQKRSGLSPQLRPDVSHLSSLAPSVSSNHRWMSEEPC